ncbi:leucyl aminopeptidase [Actinokineospora auranticolor]|uniref:Probable cytosol aminopeptidase n=1 Tax=Actinokineospora auranticolor TaxID=155976 RepID=A0A2S6GY35_9PSEU|nr:leucyl aminopeptidase [Actinokineospora auranticolor]PPK70144.1 leucyl aminopeptidase [Actinokineospora auranticolor]
MSTPVPTLPTTLPDVDVPARARAGAASIVLTRTSDGAGPALIGPGGDDLTPDWVDAVGLTGKAGEVLPGPLGSATAWVVGIGAGKPEHWRTAGAALARAIDAGLAADPEASATAAVHLPDDTTADEAALLARGLRLGGYRYRVTEEEPEPRLRSAALVVSDKDRRDRIAAAVRRSSTLDLATAFARDLANTPSNVKDPAWLARTAAKAAGRIAGLDTHVRDERWLADHGFGGLLAVGGGSSRPPRLLHLSWSPPDAEGPHIALVGKGITFDTGGISIKPNEGMHLMRTDMAGGAAVIAATLAIARLALPVRVTALVPCAENHVSGSAYRPGDIVRHYGGRTTEVLNTDAEGRMVLADGLVYARDLGADILVDAATLTGAMKVSLGVRIGGLFANDDEVASRLADAGASVGESWWRMPLLDQYAAEVASDIADVRQCPPGPGAITAALFLREFVGDLPWAHLDIAGPARADRTYDDVVPGASGFAARTLVEYVASYVAGPRS